MDDHVHPTIAASPHRFWPMQPAQQPTEAERIAADIYNAQHKERLRQERAMALQLKYESDPC